MLNYLILKQSGINYFKNGFYLDYKLRYFSKTIVYKVLINLAFFFAEKYLIEFNTKFIFNYFSYTYFQNINIFQVKQFFPYTILICINIICILY